MSNYVDIARGVPMFIKGLKGFKSKESFITFIEGNKLAGRLPERVDAEKAWKAVEKHTSAPVQVKKPKAKKHIEKKE